MGLGIAAERHFELRASILLVAGLAAAVVAVIRNPLRQSPSSTGGVLSALAVLLVWFAVGAFRSQLDTSAIAPDDISRQVPESIEIPVRLLGRLASTPEIRPPRPDAPDWMRLPSTRFELRLESIDSGIAGPPCPASGLVAVTIDGHCEALEPGDRVRIVGTIATPSAARNPGDFDYRATLKNRGIRRILRGSHPECLALVERGESWWDWPERIRGRIRAASLAFLSETLPGDVRPLAASLLLGDRTELSEDLESDFAASGTMHILAISGQHVMIFLLLLRTFGRIANLAPRTMLYLLFAGVLLYGILTDQRPPVLRATLLSVFILAGLRWGRQSPGINALGASAIVLLFLNPRHLDDVGAQLSFLAVLAIVWGARRLSRWKMVRAVGPDLTPERSRLGQLAGTIFDWVWTTQLLTAAVWLFTLPLQMSVFHLAAPVGFVINVVLSPLVVLLLGAGYLDLAAGLAAGWLAAPVGWLFTGLLRLFLVIIRGAAGCSLGHFEVPGAPGWWLWGFYSLLFFLTVARTFPWQRAAIHGLAIWTIAGLAFGLRPQTTGSLTCTVLAVGHGGAILLETPGGETLLYDCGAMGGGERTATTVRNLLWQRRRTGLDAVILSHADADHFNALPSLLRSVRVGEVLVSREFFDFSQPDVEATCAVVASSRTPIRKVAAGDTIEMSSEAVVRVLHPPPHFDAPQDNANSVVLEVEAFGRVLLLTGDLEQKGLARLLTLPPRRVDLLLAPHHGSRAANPPDLGRWAVPRIVVASTPTAVSDELRRAYPDAETMLATGISGAITIEIDSTGDLRVTPFRRRVDSAPRSVPLPSGESQNAAPGRRVGP